jgi:hypothetical protein
VILVYALLGHVTYYLYIYFVDFVDFACLAQASELVELEQASSLHCIIIMPKADVVNMSSSDTEEALDLLFQSPAHGSHSPASNPRSGTDSDMFEDWPEVNDMATSVYVALIVDALSSRASTIDVLCGVREFFTGGSPSQQSHSWTASSKKPQRWKTTLSSASWGRSKEMKIDAERALAAPTSRGGSLSTVNFNMLEWEIMYPLFVEEGLVDSSEHVNGKDA